MPGKIAMTTFELGAEGIAVALDLTVGHLAALTVETDGRSLRPLHRAPWADEPDARFPDGTAPNVRRLSGDFFCAPFGVADLDQAPPHGWPANSAWSLVEDKAIAGGRQALFRLGRTVMGATVDKLLTLRDGHPFLYQEHRLTGGAGAVPVAHHTMVRMADGGTLAFSPKKAVLTPDRPLESEPARGRSILRYPQRAASPSAVMLDDGSRVDLGVYPPGESHEDFAQMVEAPGVPLGYTACLRRAEQDLVLVLKDPRALPVTMLWYSNGGRRYAPWSSRHVGVLGIEDGCSAVGHSQSLGDNPVRREGVPTALELAPGRVVSVRHVIGAAAAAGSEGTVTSVAAEAGALHVAFADGSNRRLPFDGGFLAGRAGPREHPANP